ncbi:hypothetical protein ANN_08431 [Periplaneta americana]|uniref:Uncharacterized protein n=1 Tax=Periplaneta americana TaxID=6978 RepID=A0ABQ8T1E4_PERAM|nr:hypothetical protein ANN_08431 [Periplaneta americana]
MRGRPAAELAPRVLSKYVNIDFLLYRCRFEFQQLQILRNLSTPTKFYFENNEQNSKCTRVTRRDSKDNCNEHSERERQLDIRNIEDEDDYGDGHYICKSFNLSLLSSNYTTHVPGPYRAATFRERN